LRRAADLRDGSVDCRQLAGSVKREASLPHRDSANRLHGIQERLNISVIFWQFFFRNTWLWLAKHTNDFPVLSLNKHG
jgi:hypothetical protein